MWWEYIYAIYIVNHRLDGLSLSLSLSLALSLSLSLSLTVSHYV